MRRVRQYSIRLKPSGPVFLSIVESINKKHRNCIIREKKHSKLGKKQEIANVSHTTIQNALEIPRCRLSLSSSYFLNPLCSLSRLSLPS